MAKVNEPIIKRLDKKIYVAVEESIGSPSYVISIYTNRHAIQKERKKLLRRYKWWLYISIPYLLLLLFLPIAIELGYVNMFIKDFEVGPFSLLGYLGIALANPFIFMLEARIKQRRLEHALELLEIKKELETELYLSDL